MNDNDNMESFAQLFEENAPKPKRLSRGEKITAPITSISGEYVFIDVGGKGEGTIHIDEVRDEEGRVTVAPGDSLEVYFLGSTSQGQLFTTRLGGGSAATGHLHDAFRNQIPVEGLVKQEVKGGFEVSVGDIRCFCPFSQIDLRRREESDTYINERFSFRIIEYKEEGRNIILSRRILQEEMREEQKEALKETLKEGMSVKGPITSIRDFGAFVDLGGIDGLIPISEIGWSRVESVHDELSVGQEVEVVVLKLDWAKDRVSLSLKQALPDPWQDIGHKFPVGATLTGTVARLMNFGAFVTLAPGIDGLLHISKLGAGKRINHPREVVEEGQAVEVMIEKIEEDKKRISLTLAGQEAAEGDETDPAADFRDFQKKSAAPGKPSSMGTLGDLLKNQLKKKKK